MSVQFKKRASSTKQNLRTVRAVDDDDEEDGGVVINKTVTTSKTSVIGGSTAKSVTTTDVIGGAVTTVFDSSREVVPQKYAGDATYTTEVDTAIDRDARAILEKSIKMSEDGEGGGPGTEPGVYKGLAGYKSFIQKDMAQVGANKFTGTQGPIRAPTFVRVTSRFDYQPDICKDYKETGFCGYGDSCKFLHDRGDYKSGWQLEREWDEVQTKKKKKLEDSIKTFGDEFGEKGKGAGDADDDGENYAIDSDEDELPFACFICREPFNNPVVTVCGHYFCGNCAFDACKANGNKCPTCNKQTFGVFNKATKIIKKLAQQAKNESSSTGISSGMNGSVTAVAALPVKKGRWETVEN